MFHTEFGSFGATAAASMSASALTTALLESVRSELALQPLAVYGGAFSAFAADFASAAASFATLLRLLLEPPLRLLFFWLRMLAPHLKTATVKCLDYQRSQPRHVVVAGESREEGWRRGLEKRVGKTPTTSDKRRLQH